VRLLVVNSLVLLWLASGVAPHLHAALHHETASACCLHAEEHDHERCLHRPTESVFQHQCPATGKAISRVLEKTSAGLLDRSTIKYKIFNNELALSPFLLTSLFPRAPPLA
jgi:hypothetical protein